MANLHGIRVALDGPSSCSGITIWFERFSDGYLLGMVKLFPYNHLLFEHTYRVFAFVVIHGLRSVLTRIRTSKILAESPATTSCTLMSTDRIPPSGKLSSHSKSRSLMSSIIEFPSMPEAEDAITRLTGQEIRGIPVKLELAPVSCAFTSMSTS